MTTDTLPMATLKPSLREQAEAISLDDLVIPGIGGREIRPFVGETIWLQPYLEQQEQRRIQTIVSQFQNADGEHEEEEALAALREMLSKLFLDWDITDSRGEPYPKPHGNPDAFDRHSAAVLYQFCLLLMGGELPKGKVAAGSSSRNGSSTRTSTPKTAAAKAARPRRGKS